MRKLLVSNMVSVDGFFAGPNGEIDWHNVDGEFNEYAIDMLNSVDLLIFGRVTYQMMESYWPTKAANTDDPIVAEKMNTLPKVVFSKTLEKAEWNNSKLIKDNIAQEITRMKNEPGKDMIILGSGTIVQYFADHGLIDEYRLIVNPVILGKGKPLFKDIKNRINLKLINLKKFNSGNILMYYQPSEKEEMK